MIIFTGPENPGLCYTMAETKTYIDQMGRTVEIVLPLRRIVSLVPSQTELLADLGLSDRLAGVTKFCIHPSGLKERVGQIGGTKTVKIEEVVALKPDLVIGNKEENLQSDIEELERHVPVWMSDIHDLDSALEMIRCIGELTGTIERTGEITNRIQENFSELKPFIERKTPIRTLYLIWRKPYMAAGKNTFIDDCLSRCGLQNCLSETRYPEVDIAAADPDLILLSSEPYPFKERHIAELQQHFPKARIILADGEYFSWYGTRLLGAPAYFRELVRTIGQVRPHPGS
jgi:ABC-type Fe3+-hydroxamate transport system substrate-binding protein